MIVITLTNVPPKLRGDLSKWLFEISTGVYVGKLSFRVRENLWDRITESISEGTATMVYTCHNEQGFDFRVHNSSWEPRDYDGFKLMVHPVFNSKQSNNVSNDKKAPISKARALENSKARNISNVIKQNPVTVVLDLETTGLDPNNDEIIEIGYLLIENEVILEEKSILLCPTKPIPDEITALTGLKQDDFLNSSPRESALQFIREIMKDRIVIFHNAPFDISFLKTEWQRWKISVPDFVVKDTLKIAKKRVPKAKSRKLDDLCLYFNLPVRENHRAVTDCKITWEIYKKLNEVK